MFAFIKRSALVIGLIIWLLIQIMINNSSGSVQFNGIIFLLIGLTILGSWRVLLVAALISGVILDWYAATPFGLFIITLLATAIALELLFARLFTNYSIYSLLMMGLIGMVLYHAIFFSLASMMFYTGVSHNFFTQGYWRAALGELLVGEAVLAAAFFIINFYSRRFRRNFIRI